MMTDLAKDLEDVVQSANSMSLSRRRFSVLVSGLALSSLLAACGGDDDDDDAGDETTDESTSTDAATETQETATDAESTSEDSDATDEATTAGESATDESAASPTEDSSSSEAPDGDITRGGTLIYARNLDTQTLDPHYSAAFSERYSLYLLFNTLVGYDTDFSIIPELASSWTIAEDGLSITFQLQEGVLFHDGTPCDAEAIKWNFDRIMNPDLLSPMRSQLAIALDSVEALDATTVRFNLLKAWRPILASLGERPGFIVSPTAVQEQGEDFARNPVGSGPFRFSEWVQDSHIALDRFEDYWDDGKPYLDRIEIRHVPEQQVQLTMVRTGEAHLLDALDPGLMPTIENADGIVVETLESARFTGTQADLDKPPFDNPDLRKALAYATNREQVLEVIYAGYGRIATHPLGGGWAYDASLDGEFYPFDLDKAREHLELSGYANETLTLTASNTQQAQQIAQLLQAQFQEIGLSVEISTVNSADSFALVKDDVTNWTGTNWAPRADPDGLLRILWYSEGFQNTTGFNNPDVDRLLDEAAAIYDTAEAAEIYHEVERIITETADYTFHVWPSVIAVRREELQGFVYHPDLIIRMRDFYLSNS